MHYSDDYIDAPWGKICVVRAGHSGKPLVLLHGIVDNAGGLQYLMNVIRPSYNVHIIELPGCGNSDPFPPGLPLHFVGFVEVVRIVVEHYKLDKFYFIGHSMGAQVGLLYHALYPGKIQRYTAIDSLLYPPIEAEHYTGWYKTYIESYFEPKTYEKRTSPTDKGPAYTYDQALSLIMKSRGIGKDPAVHILNRSLKRIPNSDKFRFTWDQRIKHVITPTFPIKFQLGLYGKMDIPHFIVFADQSINNRIQLMNPKILEFFYHNNPHFRVAIVKGNHDVHLNSPAVVGQLISDFLESDIPLPRGDIDRHIKELVELQEKKGNIYLKCKI